MGAGNPLLRSYDEELYSPKTYYIDFTESYTEESKLQSIKEHYEANEIDGFEDLSDEEIQNEFYELLEWDLESFQDDYFFNLEEPFNNWWHVPDKYHRCIDDLSAAYRGSAIVLAENDDCLILTTTEAEIHHYPIGLVPKFTLQDIAEDYYYENQEKEEWYDARNLDFDDRCNKMAKRIYEKKLNKWLKTYEPFMRYFHSHWGKQLSIRNGAWMSYSVSKVGDDYEFL